MSRVRVHLRDKNRHIDLRLDSYDVANLADDLANAQGGIAGNQTGPPGPYTFIPREAIAYVEVDP